MLSYSFSLVYSPLNLSTAWDLSLCPQLTSSPMSLKKAQGRLDWRQGAKTRGSNTVGPTRVGPELRLHVTLLALKLGHGGLIDILRALLKGGTDPQDV